MFASAYNSPTMVSFLVDSGADIKANDFLRESNALHLATRLNPNPETTRALVETGLDLESLDKDQQTPLILAARFNKNIEVVHTLLDLGADTTAQDNSGKTAFDYLNARLNKQISQYPLARISTEFEQEMLAQLRP